MDWELILKAYPDDREGILEARSFNEDIKDAVKDYRLPAISLERISEGDFQQLTPVLSKICKKAWEVHFGTQPSFDMTSAADAFIWGGSINVPEAHSAAIGVLLNNALRAVLKRLRNGSSYPEKAGMQSGRCAFCGTNAHTAFDEEAQRVLHCQLCGFSWKFPRIRCPYCGNTDHEKLGFFEAEGIDGVKVYFCRECGCFIKVFDAKGGVLSDAETMDALTLELDMLAKEEGFTPIP